VGNGVEMFPEIMGLKRQTSAVRMTTFS